MVVCNHGSFLSCGAEGNADWGKDELNTDRTSRAAHDATTPIISTSLHSVTSSRILRPKGCIELAHFISLHFLYLHFRKLRIHLRGL